MDNIEMPFIGKRFKVISGPYKDFVGKCVSYDLEHDLPVILQDDNWYGAAVRLHEIESIDFDNKIDLSQTQKN